MENMDRQVKDFIWSGMVDHLKPMVDYNTLVSPKDKGGMGLISIKGQTMALVAKVILLVVEEGEHTLQCIVREKISDLSKHKWGQRDYSWLVNNCRNKPVGRIKTVEQPCWCLEYQQETNQT